MRQVTHALLTRPPLSQISVRKLQSASFDLHVLSTPPAFILSQDQTLIFRICFLDFSSPAGLLRKSILYLVFVLLNLFLESFRVGHAVQLSRFIQLSLSGEEGIWTLAPLLTTYSLSRGAPSATWVLLQISRCHNRYLITVFSSQNAERREWDSNPRALADKRFSRPPRYDHFDISPQRCLVFYLIHRGLSSTFFYFLSHVISQAETLTILSLFQISVKQKKDFFSIIYSKFFSLLLLVHLIY